MISQRTERVAVARKTHSNERRAILRRSFATIWTRCAWEIVDTATIAWYPAELQLLLPKHAPLEGVVHRRGRLVLHAVDTLPEAISKQPIIPLKTNVQTHLAGGARHVRCRKPRALLSKRGVQAVLQLCQRDPLLIALKFVKWGCQGLLSQRCAHYWLVLLRHRTHWIWRWRRHRHGVVAVIAVGEACKDGNVRSPPGSLALALRGEL